MRGIDNRRKVQSRGQARLTVLASKPPAISADFARRAGRSLIRVSHNRCCRHDGGQREGDRHNCRDLHHGRPLLSGIVRLPEPAGGLCDARHALGFSRLVNGRLKAAFSLGARAISAPRCQSSGWRLRRKRGGRPHVHPIDIVVQLCLFFLCHLFHSLDGAFGPFRFFAFFGHYAFSSPVRGRRIGYCGHLAGLPDALRFEQTKTCRVAGQGRPKNEGNDWSRRLGVKSRR
jgi:hypothetical protein